MGNNRVAKMPGHSNWGDDRHTQQEYSNQNTDALHLTVQSDRHVTEGADLDREYQYAMQKVGMDGVITMERMAEGKMKQKSVALALSAIRRAFEPYDHDQSGDVTPEVFRKALEVYGLQFQEDQVLALFGCYDKGRSGRIHYPQWVKQVSVGKFVPQKVWNASIEWAEREAKWAALEQKWEHNEPAPQQGGGGGDAFNQLESVHSRFFQQGQAGWKLPNTRQVQEWLQGVGLDVSIEQARRVLFQLDPCDREQGCMSVEEFVAWWDLSNQGTQAILVSDEPSSHPASRNPVENVMENRAANGDYKPYWAIAK